MPAALPSKWDVDHIGIPQWRKPHKSTGCCLEVQYRRDQINKLHKAFQFSIDNYGRERPLPWRHFNYSSTHFLHLPQKESRWPHPGRWRRLLPRPVHAELTPLPHLISALPAAYWSSFDSLAWANVMTCLLICIAWTTCRFELLHRRNYTSQDSSRRTTPRFTTAGHPGKRSCC